MKTVGAATLLTLATVLSGCMGGSSEDALVTIGVQQALDIARSTLADLAGAQLIFASGTEAETAWSGDDGLDGTLKKWELGYYLPEVNAYRIVTVHAGGGLDERLAYGIVPQATIAQPLSLSSPIDSAATLQAAVSALGIAPASPSLGDKVIYWLSNVSGINVWQVSIVPMNGSASTTFLDADTNAPVAVSQPTTLGLSGALAAVAASAPTGVLPVLIEAWAMEVEQGGVYPFFGAYHHVEGIILAPDQAAGDGKSDVWVLVYRDMTRNVTSPVVVVAGLAPIRGHDLPVGWTNETYTRIGLSMPVLDADAALGAAGVTLTDHTMYRLAKRSVYANPSWWVKTPSAPGPASVVELDAKTGVLL